MHVRKIKAAISALAVAACGYIFADAWDLVPGFLTMTPAAGKGVYLWQPRGKTVSVKLPGQTSSAPLPNPSAVSRALSELETDSRVTGTVSALIQDADTGKELGALRADRLSTPASSMKLLTSVAFLGAYGPNTTFSTKAKLLKGKLYLVAGGDILLSSDKGSAQAVTGRGGLGDLARAAAKELRKQKLGEVSVALDTSLYGGPAYHPSWEEWGRKYALEATPISADHFLGLAAKPTPGSAGRALEEFTARLREAGITVSRTEREKAPAGAREIASVHSPTVRETVRLMMLNSDNSLAEEAAHMVGLKVQGKADFQNGALGVKKQLEKMGIDVSAAKIYDGSGLSQDNKITPRILTRILAKVRGCGGCDYSSLPAALPVAGYDGTLEKRFTQTFLAGRVRAKTGSLGEVSALAGFMYTKAGRPLIFAVIVDGTQPGSAWQARGAIDSALEKIAEGEAG